MASPARELRRRAWVLGGLAMLAALALVLGTAALWRAFVHRAPAGLRTVAAGVPASALGVVAIDSPRRAIERTAADVPGELRAALHEELGIDVLAPAAWDELAIDLDAPAGAAMLDPEHGLVAISMGTRDAEATLAALRERDTAWQPRERDGVPGLERSDPPAAIVGRDARVIAIVPIDAFAAASGPLRELGLAFDPESTATAEAVAVGRQDALERWADAIAELDEDDSLAARPALAELVAIDGETFASAWADGTSIREARYASGIAAGLWRTAFADVDGVLVALATDGARVDVVTQVVAREGSVTLRDTFAEARTLAPLDRIGGTALGGLDFAFAVDPPIERVIASMGMGSMALALAEAHVREHADLDLRRDVLDNLSGRAGVVVLDGDARPEAIAFVGVADEDAARAAAERFLAKTQVSLGTTVRYDGDVRVLTLPGSVPLHFAIAHDHLWLSTSEPALADVIAGRGDSFLDGAIEPVREVARGGGTFAAYLDARATASWWMRHGELAASASELAQLLPHLDAITMRGEVEGRTWIARLSLHASSEDALAALLREGRDRGGREALAELRGMQEERACGRAADAVAEKVAQRRLALALGPDDATSVRGIVRDACAGEDIDWTALACWAEAGDLAALAGCRGGETLAARVTPSEPEPTPVASVDDLWPARATASNDGRPHPDASYAVEEGPAPLFRGAERPLVTIVELCPADRPACTRADDALTRVVEAQPHDVRVVSRQLLDEADRAAARALGIADTPSLFVNGRHLAAPIDPVRLDALVAEEMDRARKFVERRGNSRVRLYADMIAHFSRSTTGLEAIGIAVCDEYIEKYMRCLEEKFPESVRSPARDAMKQVTSAWRQAAAAGTAGREALEAGCTAARDAAAEATRAMGCAW